MEVGVARTVGWLMAEVFRPVAGVDDLGAGAEHGLHVGGEIGERANEGIGAGAVAHGGQAAHLRADDEGVHSSGGGREMGVVQDEAAVGPLGWTGVADGLPVDGEVRHIGKADEGGDLRRGGGGLVRRARLAGRRGDGDAAAPGIDGLRGSAGVRIGEGVSSGHIHEDEGRERDLEPARLEVLDGGDYGVVGGRAAVGRPVLDEADDMRILAVEPRDTPGEGVSDLVRRVDAGPELAELRAQVGAEPADDERDGTNVGQRRLQLVDRHGPIGAALARVHVLGRVADGPDLARDRLLRQHELARAGDERDGAHAGLEGVDGAVHLEG